MEKPPCVLFPWDSWGWNIIADVWFSFIVALLIFARSRLLRGEPMRIVEFPSISIMMRMPVFTYITYSFGIISQLSPIGILRRVLPSPLALFLPGGYEFMWFFLVAITASSPALTAHLAPLFLWWSWEYVAMMMYGIFLLTTTPAAPEEDSERLGWEYQALFSTLFAYFTVVFMAAALYHAHPQYLGQDTLSPRDALYFSSVTITTIGYGDIVPQDCLRRVVVWEVLMGIFIIVVVVSLIIGAIINRISGSQQSS